MLRPDLSTERAPPFWVPLRFFITAPLFGIAAGLLLVWSGPAGLATRWSPVSLALTHLLTLGFLASVMMGAVIQLLAVLAGAPVPQSPLIIATTHLALLAGAVLLVAAFLSGVPALYAMALILLALSFVVFMFIAATSLLRVPADHPTVRGMRFAVVGLAVTIALGLYLGADSASGVMESRAYTDLHALWGMAGWVGMLIVAVGFQVVPMFQITPDYSPVLTRTLVIGVLVGLVIWSAAGWAAPLHDTPWGRALGHLGLGATGGALAAFAIATLTLQRRRRRRIPDPTLWHWRVAMLGLLAWVALALAGAFDHAVAADPRYDLLLGVLFLLGFAISVMTGMLYKIVPFLVWLHSGNHLAAQGKSRLLAPNMKQVIPEARIRRQTWLYWLALLLTLAAVFEPETFARAAGLGLAAAWAGLWWNIYSAVALHRRFLATN